jgi:hypothetical protein
MMRLPMTARDVAERVIEDEFWPATQRAGNALHEVPYRACFKPQLPEHFITRFTQLGDIVLDPFLGRGTTALEAALLGRIPVGVDINPLSAMLARPRLQPPDMPSLEARLRSISWQNDDPQDPDLLAYYHPDTLRQLLALRQYLSQRTEDGTLDSVDDWIRMVALTRLSGHSAHFFSVYTLPPNQATYPERQRKINASRNQTPEPRNVAAIILKKTRSLCKKLNPDLLRILSNIAPKALFLTGPSDCLKEIKANSVKLVVTSPPFLNEVDYRLDNWLRCWFVGLDSSKIPISQLRKVTQWQEMMRCMLVELHGKLRRDARVAIEVGEVRKGSVQLEDPLAAAALDAGYSIESLMIHCQNFTKTSNCWGISNGVKGTNSHRILVLRPHT